MVPHNIFPQPLEAFLVDGSEKAKQGESGDQNEEENLQGRQKDGGMQVVIAEGVQVPLLHFD